MAPRSLPDKDTLCKLLDYDPESGLLIWLHRPREMFPPTPKGEQAFRVWNMRYAGWPAFTIKIDGGYRAGSIFYVRYLAHRVIWKMRTGEEPSHVDHINGETSDNRWNNLRATDAVGNVRNQGRSRLNKSGTLGVRYRADSDRWIAFIGGQGRHVHLGSFRTKAAAVDARKRAERELGFATGHGERESPKWRPRRRLTR